MNQFDDGRIGHRRLLEPEHTVRRQAAPATGGTSRSGTVPGRERDFVMVAVVQRQRLERSRIQISLNR